MRQKFEKRKVFGGLCVKSPISFTNFLLNNHLIMSLLNVAVDSTTNLSTIIAVDVRISLEEFNEIQSNLQIDPRSLRLKVKEDAKVLYAIAEAIVVTGPKPDKTLNRLNKRVGVKESSAEKIRVKARTILAFVAKYAIKGTQFQAAFPDYIWKVRRDYLDINAPLQRFCGDTVLPIEFQFPGSGPILPLEYRKMEHYGVFVEALTKALSQGKQETNWLIANKSIEWVVKITDPRFTRDYKSPEKDEVKSLTLGEEGNEEEKESKSEEESQRIETPLTSSSLSSSTASSTTTTTLTSTQISGGKSKQKKKERQTSETTNPHDDNENY